MNNELQNELPNNNNGWMNQHDVISFLQMNNPGVNQTARAFYLRDVGMGLDFNELTNKALTKLGYTQNAIEQSVRHKFRKYLNVLVNDFLNNPESDPFENNTVPQLYHNFVTSQQNNIDYRVARYNLLSNYLNNNQHQEFYQAMTLPELECLGW